MKKLLPVALVVLTLVFTVVVLSGYQRANAGRLLADKYFLAIPADGYGTQRALTPSGDVGAEASILRQGIRYHQQGDFDRALVSLRAYLDDQPVTEEYLPAYLAGTAAFATGRYEESREFIAGMTRTTRSAQAAYHWQTALLSLRDEDFPSARVHLEEVRDLLPAVYPVEELLGRLP